jgi:dihydrofolate reductase
LFVANIFGYDYINSICLIIRERQNIMIALIACVDKLNGIGRRGIIPWQLPPDIEHFKNTTNGAVVIMGRLTWESIGSKPLPNRINVVISSQTFDSAFCYASMDGAMSACMKLGKPIFIIGGSRIYREALPYTNCGIITRIANDFQCDTFFPFMDMVEHMAPDLCGAWTQYENITYRYERWNKKIRASIN